MPYHRHHKNVGLLLLGDGRLVTEGLSGWWKHDEGTGLVLKDYHGSDNGVINAAEAPFWANFDCGTYDGTDDWVAGFDSHACPTAITLIIGGYLNSVVEASARCLLSKVTTGVVGNYKILRIGSSDELRFTYSNSAQTWHAYDTSNFNLAATTWTIIAFVFTFGSGATAKFYKNNSPITGSWTVGDGSISPDLTGYLNFGRDAVSGQYLLGRLRDVLIYNRQLSVDELTFNYNHLKERYGL